MMTTLCTRCRAGEHEECVKFNEDQRCACDECWWDDDQIITPADGEDRWA